MLIGQTVFIPASGSPGVQYHGPWMPRQGNSFTGAMEILKASSSGWTFKCSVETKNAEDPDSAAVGIGSAIAMTAAGTQTESYTGCLELVRYVFDGLGAGTDRWIHYRMNPPIWQPN